MSWHVCPKCKEVSLPYKGYCAKCMKEYRKIVSDRMPKIICKSCGSQEFSKLKSLPPQGALKKTDQAVKSISKINRAMKSLAKKKNKETPKLEEQVEIPLSSEYDTLI